MFVIVLKQNKCVFNDVLNHKLLSTDENVFYFNMSPSLLIISYLCLTKCSKTTCFTRSEQDAQQMKFMCTAIMYKKRSEYIIQKTLLTSNRGRHC